jgi:SAM-dependent methyltransferase
MATNQATTTPSYHSRCLISGSEKLRPLKGYEKDYLVKSSPVGFVFSAKIPTEEELIACYEGYAREEYLSPVTAKRFNELLDGFEPYRKTGRILDIGCDTGLFLLEAKKRGWEVYGTEYTETALQKCRANGIQMQQGKLNPSLYEPEMFDVITLMEVIEHINNPQEEIQNIKQLLRPGGLFYFTTPNFNSIERYVLKGKYNIIAYPEHLSYYTKKTVHYLLRRYGFKKVKLTTTGISISRLRSSLGKQEKIGGATSSDEALRTRLEKGGFNQLIKKILNWTLDVTGLGSSLKGWYIK